MRGRPSSALLPAQCLESMAGALISVDLVCTVLITRAHVRLRPGPSHPFAFRFSWYSDVLWPHLRLGVGRNLTLGFPVLSGPFLPLQGRSGTGLCSGLSSFSSKKKKNQDQEIVWHLEKKRDVESDRLQLCNWGLLMLTSEPLSPRLPAQPHLTFMDQKQTQQCLSESAEKTWFLPWPVSSALPFAGLSVCPASPSLHHLSHLMCMRDRNTWIHQT